MAKQTCDRCGLIFLVKTLKRNKKIKVNQNSVQATLPILKNSARYCPNCAQRIN